ncbi:MAG: RelA/SpoT family protein [Sphaerochaetaceae bacterium]|nr:RelA/SpoT family protein [Sphaerochaetaceae bacterium]NLO60511.1 bifunctional (p)ppGpp synthetase/guanosine-3',5'-bis(diphosphate) 3'-pyrophosphohydrolase [Spirochaetales bacterium]MDD2406347.1 RelA/SpoT family protein [Sphaerochaetaceae bacterium]MDD3670545.1 RelA/SpoT family protein [Sphaerochaetaceae bacterium]MDD4258237.1 RelA/SpoT family protein [Sphaerochaetaceae bacterium]
MYEELTNRFVQKAFRYNKAEQERIREAALFAVEFHGSQKRQSGEPYIIHPFAVAEILMSLKMDVDTVVAGLLHDTLEDTEATYEMLVEKFGQTVADLVEGETKISTLKAKNKTQQESETIRKMFFAMAKDVRVIIIKLADKLHNMRTLQHLSPMRAREIASECLDIFAPLADRLGMSWLKGELEDQSLKILKPETFQYIEEYLLSKKSERTAYLNRIEKILYRTCGEEGLGNVTVQSRTKHTYGVYMKMKKRKKELEEIGDILGVRIICDTVTECYTLLGLVHRLWPPIEGRFKDYIAMPKANNYQSLHTTVMALDGKLLEVQIRTKEMHVTAEYGVAAHWVYKSEMGLDTGNWTETDNQHFSKILKRLKSWSTEIEQSESVLDDIKGELLKDTIYVFTPQGHIVELPANATALDFAYHIHTEIGNHCTGAKADGSIIPLSQPLKNTQVIEILTSPNARPNINWLRLAQTTNARKKIRSWLNKNDDNLIIAKNIIAKKKPQVLAQQSEIQEPSLQPSSLISPEEIVRSVIDQGKLAFRVGDEKNLMISLAQCCNPRRGDEIIGYVSRGRGIIVHRKNCHNLKNMTEIDQRSIEVEWESANPLQNRRFRVVSRITQDLFAEIEGAIKKYKGHLIEGRLDDGEQDRLIGSFTMEVANEEDFKKVVKSIKAIPAIISINPL